MFGRYRLGYQVLLLLAGTAFAVSFVFGVAPLEKYVPDGAFVRRMLPAWVLIPLLWAGFVSVEIARRQVDRPFVAVRRMLYRHRHWLMRGALFMLMVLYFAYAFMSFKKAIPSYVPYYADPWLAAWDRAIFGTDPWRITHSMIGGYGTVVIDRVYALWFPIMMLYVGWFCFTRDQFLQLRGLLTYVLAWAVLGNFVALGLSSVGPCFYERFYADPQFAPMMAQLQAIHSEHALFAPRAMDYLIDSIGKDRLGAGISAMPSLHVAIAFLCLLVAWEYGRHWWAKLVSFLFFVAILVGSVHLGWHYAVDGIVSIVVTGLIWWGTGRFVRWVEKREAAQAESAAPPLAIPAPA
jgi:PAP2 superfamily